MKRFLFIALALTILYYPPNADSAPSVEIKPGPDAPPGYIDLQVKIQDVTDLDAFLIVITFDPGDVSIGSATSDYDMGDLFDIASEGKLSERLRHVEPGVPGSKWGRVIFGAHCENGDCGTGGSGPSTVAEKTLAAFRFQIENTAKSNTAIWNDLIWDDALRDDKITVYLAEASDFKRVMEDGNGNRMGTLSGPLMQYVHRGSDSTRVTAQPNAGYRFDGWEGTYPASGTSLTVSNVKDDHILSPEFTPDTAPDTYTVSFTAGTGGSISGNRLQTVEAGGNTTIVTPVADEGYRFSGWSGDYQGAEVSLIIYNVNRNMTINARFEPFISSYRVRFLIQGSGQLTGDTDQVVEAGEDCTSVAAAANPGHEFVGWTGDFQGEQNPLRIQNVTRNMNITAVFTNIHQHTVTFQSAEGGELNGDLSQTVVDGGSTTEVEAVAQAGFRFYGWTGDYEGTLNPLTLPNITRDMTITAHFVPDDQFVVQFNAGENGRLEGEAVQYVLPGESTTPVLAVADPGYYALPWEGAYSGEENPLAIEGVQGDMRISVSFTPVPAGHHHVTFLWEENGRLFGNTRQIVASGEDAEPVNALGDDGYFYKGYSGDRQGVHNPIIVSDVINDITITAEFGEVPPGHHVVVFMVDEHGRIEGNNLQVIPAGGDTTPVTAVPEEGYRFTAWSGDVDASNPVLTLSNIGSNMEIRAVFSRIIEGEWLITASAGQNGEIDPLGTVGIFPGENKVYRILPDSGYIVDTVFVDDVEVGSVSWYVFTEVSSNHTIRATFRSNETDEDGDGAPDEKDRYPDDPARATMESVSATGTIKIDTSRNNGTNITDMHVLSDSDPILKQDGRPAGYDFLDGLVFWRIDHVSPGRSITVDIIFPSPLSETAVFFFVDEAGFFEYTDVQLLGKTARLTLTDGGTGDLDRRMNGVIEGRGGIAVMGDSEPAATGGEAGGSGCFLQTLYF